MNNQRRLSWEEAINELETDSSGMRKIVQQEKIPLRDERIEAIVKEMVRLYPRSTHGNFTYTLKEAEHFARSHSLDERMTFVSSDIDRIKRSFIEYGWVLETLFGYGVSRQELIKTEPDLASTIDSRLVPITHKGKDHYLLSNVRDTKRDITENPKYTRAQARIITDRVAKIVYDTITSGHDFKEFCAEFGISEERLNDYIARGIIKTGSSGVVDTVLKEAHDAYPQVTLSETRVREACSEHPLLKEVANGKAISNREGFVKGLISIDELTRRLYDNHEFIIGIAQDFLSNNYAELPLVRNEGVVYVHEQDKEKIINKLKHLPGGIIRQHLTDEFSCTEADLKQFRTSFSCLDPNFVLDKEGAVKFMQELEDFRSKLYDGKRLAGELKTNYNITDELLAKMVAQHTSSTRTYSGRIHETHAKQIADILTDTAINYGANIETILTFIELNMANFVAPGKGIFVDEKKVEKSSIPLGDIQRFSKSAYEASKSKSFEFKGRERVLSAEAKLMLEKSEDLTEIGLYALAFFEGYNDTRIQRRIKYVCRQLDIQSGKSLDPRDPDRYILKTDVIKVISALDNLKKQGIRIDDPGFIDAASPYKPTFYTRKEATEFLQGKEMPETLKPRIYGIFELYDASELSQEVRSKLISLSSHKDKMSQLLEGLDTYGILYLAARIRKINGRPGLDEGHLLKLNQIDLASVSSSFSAKKPGYLGLSSASSTTWSITTKDI